MEHPHLLLHGLIVGIKGVLSLWVVDAILLQFKGVKGNEPEEVLVKSPFLSQRQRCVLRDEAYLRVKKEEHGVNGVRALDAGLNVINRLAVEFEQGGHMFGYHPKFLVEVESGKFGASLDPDCEPSRMKQVSEAWKKDYGARP